jgi:hypothetical protein
MFMLVRSTHARARILAATSAGRGPVTRIHQRTAGMHLALREGEQRRRITVEQAASLVTGTARGPHVRRRVIVGAPLESGWRVIADVTLRGCQNPAPS